jgi:hypothetical protein
MEATLQTDLHSYNPTQMGLFELQIQRRSKKLEPRKTMLSSSLIKTADPSGNQIHEEISRGDEVNFILTSPSDRLMLWVLIYEALGRYL